MEERIYKQVGDHHSRDERQRQQKQHRLPGHSALSFLVLALAIAVMI